MKISEGLKELMMYRVNRILYSKGQVSLVFAVTDYVKAMELTESFGIDCTEYRDIIGNFILKSKLEKLSK